MTTLIHADTYSATRQAVSDAIDRSAKHGEIVTIRTGYHYAFCCTMLAELCNDNVVTSDERSEYWGRTDDGEEWRVHVIDRT